MDLTGLGTKGLHRLEAFSRILIGVIFAVLAMLLVKSGLIFSSIEIIITDNYLLPVLGFCAGFSEKWIPSILERFVDDQENPAKSPDIK